MGALVIAKSVAEQYIGAVSAGEGVITLTADQQIASRTAVQIVVEGDGSAAAARCGPGARTRADRA